MRIAEMEGPDDDDDDEEEDDDDDEEFLGVSGNDLRALANYNRAKRLGLIDDADDVRAPRPACLISALFACFP